MRRELRMHMRGNSYRGPRGHLLICETPIAGSRWQHHGVDISEQGSLPLMGMAPFRTGDAAFDRRFTARHDGVPVREGWLDAATRGAVAAFFDTTPLSGSLWVQAGMLQYVATAPKGMAPGALPDVLRTQAGVALAFERTGATRVPVA